MASEGEEAAERQRAWGYAALGTAQVLFGLFPVVGKWAMEDFAPRAVAGWRIVFGAVVIGCFAWTRARGDFLPRRRDLPAMLAASLLGIVLNQVFFLEGLRRAPAINAGILMMLIPVATFALALLVRQERWSARRGAGMVVALAGALLLVFGRGPSFSASAFHGNLFLCLNGLCYSGYLVISRRLAARYPPLTLMAWTFLLAAWAAPLIAAGTTWIPEASRRSWLSLAYALIGPTVLAYALNMVALSRLSASTTAIWIAVQPLITAVASITLLGETLGPRVVAAAGLILAGLWLVRNRTPAGTTRGGE